MKDSLEPTLRRIAALSYARCAQLMQDRQDIYGSAADKINYTAVYEKIIEESPNSSDACIALFYMRPKLEDISRFGQKFDYRFAHFLGGANSYDAHAFGYIRT